MIEMKVHQILKRSGLYIPQKRNEKLHLNFRLLFTHCCTHNYSSKKNKALQNRLTKNKKNNDLKSTYKSVRQENKKEKDKQKTNTPSYAHMQAQQTVNIQTV